MLFIYFKQQWCQQYMNLLTSSSYIATIWFLILFFKTLHFTLNMYYFSILFSLKGITHLCLLSADDKMRWHKTSVSSKTSPPNMDSIPSFIYNINDILNKIRAWYVSYTILMRVNTYSDPGITDHSTFRLIDIHEVNILNKSSLHYPPSKWFRTHISRLC